MLDRRAAWAEEMPSIDPSRLVFLDESGTNTDLARLYGRSVGKRRVVDHVPLNTPRTTTILSSMRLDGSTARTVFSGSVTGERFKSYLKEVLLPTLHPGDIVVMDNLGSHKVQGVAEMIHCVGAELRYLPPYSPDLNPIEMMWSKVKAFLRKRRPRSAEALLGLIPAAFASLSSSDCPAWFSAAGY